MTCCTGMLAAGDVFGRLTLLRRIPGTRRRPVRWECECACGTRKAVLRDELVRGATKSCGCLQRELASARRKASAGRRPRDTDHELYSTWRGMRHRCIATEYEEYHLYGGRGIRVCDRWLTSFANFVADMGERPAGMSIDRIDPNGHYEPGNCRWATSETQNNNRRSNTLLTHRGQTMTMARWADTLGINYFTLATRLAEGWSVDEALTRPVNDGMRRKRRPEGATA